MTFRENLQEGIIQVWKDHEIAFKAGSKGSVEVAGIDMRTGNPVDVEYTLFAFLAAEAVDQNGIVQRAIMWRDHKL
jgi:hypothetical protein